MTTHIRLGPALSLAIKFTYYKITSVVVLSVAFWAVSLAVVTVGPAILALSETIRTLPSGNPSEREVLRTFLRSVRKNRRRGLPITALVVFVPLVTGAYLALALEGGSVPALLGAAVGVYLCLCSLFVSLRVATITVDHRSWGLRRSVGYLPETVGRAFDVAVLYTCLLALSVAVAVSFPPILVLLAPGFLVVFEGVLYDELEANDPSRYKTSLARRT
ncbi:DUF624 domain-containing protein [Natrarchaeobius sp. A-rgal3]|uniref:DUF624 domain-containing protein n=1 Tax=Natrarchaeobius versutus TaxID=1679078 RepID=UPI003510954B